MADTTIKIDEGIRDRLRTLAEERGLSTRAYVERVVAATPTADERAERTSRAIAYMPKAARDAAEATAAMVPRGAARRSEETPTEPAVEQVAQLAVDHLVAQLAAAAEQDGRTVEQLVLDHLAERAAQTVAEQNGHTTATHEGAKIIEFRPRKVSA